MTPDEAITLAEKAAACCPQQKFNEETPDAWFALLGDLTYDDALQGLWRAAREQPFVAPAEIRHHVRIIRRERLRNADRILPAADPDAKDYSARFKRHLQALADGKQVGLALMPGSRRTTAPTAEYTAARAAHAPHRDDPTPPSVTPVSSTPWCGKCHDDTRTRTAIQDGHLVRVPCPVCGPDTSPRGAA
ncbi:hypothetical protein AB0I72_19760 [Nocardiopsis sp. NPDC049922]|uniref:hypothetical protein n=1 Tax=Nocardiopsis sp. NPDC049922 TaxID=3155157 RepID=UPI0033D11626